LVNHTGAQDDTKVTKMLFDFDFLSLFRKQRPQELPWWIEITTNHPSCTYYFGPYPNHQEAADQQQGFLEDLRSEQATDIQAHIKRTQPEQLTIVQNDRGR